MGSTINSPPTSVVFVNSARRFMSDASGRDGQCPTPVCPARRRCLCEFRHSGGAGDHNRLARRLEERTRGGSAPRFALELLAVLDRVLILLERPVLEREQIVVRLAAGGRRERAR